MAKFEGTVEDIVFRNEQNGWTVAAIRIDGSGRTSAVGVMPFLSTGDLAIFEGELVEHREYGEMFFRNHGSAFQPSGRVIAISGQVKGLACLVQLMHPV